MGITADQPSAWAGEPDEDGDFEVYEENALAVSVFLSMSTQWLWSGGMETYRCGLNHAVLMLHMDKLKVPDERRFEVMDGVQTMEHAALEVWNKAAAERARKRP